MLGIVQDLVVCDFAVVKCGIDLLPNIEITTPAWKVGTRYIDADRVAWKEHVAGRGEVDADQRRLSQRQG